MRLVECVPNFSEGRRPEIVAAIRDAIAGVEGVAILDTSSDLSHNRTVITFVAPVEQAVEAAFAGIRKAQELIDLNHHTGEHPRMGAADVVPFIPLEGTTMDDCIVLARSLGERVGRELHIPVFLYERAATRPDRENLADVRRGEFEGLREQIGKDATRVPDFGPSRIHPTAGAVAIGARLVRGEAGEGLEDVGEVRRPALECPLSHRVCNGVGQRDVECLAVLERGLKLLVHVLRQEILLHRRREISRSRRTSPRRCGTRPADCVTSKP